jgi:small subunit ribosomal protein S6
MRKYEIVFVLRTDVPEEEVDKVIAQMQSVVSSTGGEIEKVEKMGRRQLAYAVERQREGYYVLFVLNGGGDTVKEFERRLKVTDAVIKFLTVRVDEELKRAEKMKALRARQEAHRARRKTAAAAPPPPAAEASQA